MRAGARLGLGGIDVIALDGGSMAFSVQRRNGQRVRLELAVRPTLVRGDGWSCLIDAGFGPADPGRRARFELQDPEPLEAQCAAYGCPAPDVVLLTHLHFDHAAGALVVAGGVERLRFSKSRHVVHADEWAGAVAEQRGGDLPARLAAACAQAGAGEFEQLGHDVALFPGLQLARVRGHTEGLMVVWVTGREGVCVVASDLVPTRRFLEPRLDRLADQEPEVALASRQAVLGAAAGRGAWVALYHDRSTAFAAIQPSDGDSFVITDAV